LLLLGIQQLGANRPRVKEDEESESQERDDISIFPLATPLLAGPGAISTVILYASDADTLWERCGLVIAIIFVLAASHLCLASAPLLYRLLGTTGLNLLTRMMGIILCAIAVQFVINGVSASISNMYPR